MAALEIVVSALKDEVLNSGVQFGISYSQAEIIAADGGSAETVLVGEESVEVFKDDTGKVVALFRSGDAVLDSDSSGIGLAPFPYTAENNPFVYSSTGGYVLGFLLAGISKSESIDALLSVASVASEEDEARNYIDDVRGILGDVESPSRVGDLRDSFHKAIVLAADPLHSNKYSLQDMVGPASAEIATIALENSDEGLAVRRALYELKPYAIVGGDYSSYGEKLSLHDNSSGTGVLTESWIRDRSEFLFWYMKDKLTADNQQLTDYQAKDGFDYKDFSRGIDALVMPDPVGGFNPRVHRVYFGSEDADTLDGNKGNDRLYGGAGNDILIGGKGNDTLVGGADNDRYEFSTGDGHDTLIDSDGLGTLWINEVPYTLAQRLAPGTDSWHSKDGKVKFLLSGSDMLVLYGQGDSIRIRDYKPGMLGLRLEEAAPAAAGGAINGTGNDDQLNGTAGNDLITGAGGSDRVFGGAGNDRIYGYKVDEFGPANPLSAGKGITGDWLDGGSGDDLLVGSNGQDGLFGVAGSDTIQGGGGNDIILADGGM